MKNEIVKSAADAMSIGEVFHKSGMFADIKSANQAVVKIMAGQEMGISPFQAMSGIHIIAGKPCIGAGLMASRVKASGKYNYKVLENSEKNCVIEFFEGKESIGKSSFSIEEARKAGTKNLDKFPRNMLFARAISNGVKWFCPDIYEGPVYVPEEMMEVEPQKKQLDPEQYKRLCKAVANGDTIGETQSAFEWALSNCDLTAEQIGELEILNLQKLDNGE